MPGTMTAPRAAELRHEVFCLPVHGENAPRIETYPAMVDDPVTGRSRRSANVRRCIECGAAAYTPLEG